jgi:diaminopimelate decarboxylase
METIKTELTNDIISNYNTPIYVYNTDKIVETLTAIKNTVVYRPFKIYYAAVTNSNLDVLNTFKNLGVGLHANTIGDIYFAFKAGFTPEDIIYSGSNLSKEEMQFLVNKKIAINVSSLSQLEQFGQISGGSLPVGLRIDLTSITPQSRMGVKDTETLQAKIIAQRYGLKINGIHYYRGTGTNDTNRFLEPFYRLMKVLDEFKSSLEYFDVGGGFGFHYNKNYGQSFCWQEFNKRLAHMLPNDITLYLEPGRCLVAEAGTLLCKVISVDSRYLGGQLVGVDTTVSHISNETYRVYGDIAISN